ncbi:MULTISPECIES: 2,4'-dihydroxyacetophenone dioxygenase family protein [Trinickia]|nr:2,4'-dihydroxyacetophenone dioxygenase family protein [Trinickia symbiotica]
MEAATKLTRIPQYEPLHFDSTKSPWHPFTPYSNDVQLKMLHIDPVSGQVTMLLKAPGGCSLGVHDHYGTIHVYTVSGGWYYEEHEKDWVAKAGDFIYEVANSKHTFKTVPGEEVVLFIILEGSIAFLDENGNKVGFENATTFQQRYIDHCLENNMPLVDLNSMVRAA